MNNCTCIKERSQKCLKFDINITSIFQDYCNCGLCMNQFYELSHFIYSNKQEYNYSVHLSQFYPYPTIHSVTRVRPSTKLTIFTSLLLSIMALQWTKVVSTERICTFLLGNGIKMYIEFNMWLCNSGKQATWITKHSKP